MCTDTSPGWYESALRMSKYQTTQEYAPDYSRDNPRHLSGQRVFNHTPRPQRDGRQCCRSIIFSVVAIMTLAIVVAVPLLFIFMFRDGTPKTSPSVPPKMEMNDSLTKPGEEITITCNVRYAPSGWDNFSIVSVDNNDIYVITYSNGTVVKGNNSYIAGIQHNNRDMTLEVRIPNTTTTTHCTARGNYVCTLKDDGAIVINDTSTVVITDLTTNLALDAKSVVQEGDRYEVNCSGRLATEEGELHLYVRSGNASEFDRVTEIPLITIDDADDTCYQSITKTYNFFGDTTQNGTELQCVATNYKLSSFQHSTAIDMEVDFADFSMTLHLPTYQWISEYDDKNSLDFKRIAAEIEKDTDFIYRQSALKDNFQKTKVIRLEEGSVKVITKTYFDLVMTINNDDGNTITTTLTETDIVSTFVNTLSLVENDLPSGIINDVDIADITGTVFITDPEQAYDCSSKTDVIFLLDASGSIGSEDFKHMKYFIQNFTANVKLGPSDIQIGVTKFSTNPNNEFWLNEHHGVLTLNPAIDDIEYTGGGTKIAAGLEYVLKNSLTVANGARQDSEKVVILMTDGVSSDNPAAVATTMRNAGVLVACVGIGNGIDMEQLKNTAYNSSYVFFASDFNVLTQIKDTVKSSSCEFDNNTKK